MYTNYYIPRKFIIKLLQLLSRIELFSFLKSIKKWSSLGRISKRFDEK